LPLGISLFLILANAAARRAGRAEPVPARPAPVMLVAISTGLFFVLADPISLVGLAGALAALTLGWRVVRAQSARVANHG